LKFGENSSRDPSVSELVADYRAVLDVDGHGTDACCEAVKLLAEQGTSRSPFHFVQYADTDRPAEYDVEVFTTDPEAHKLLKDAPTIKAGYAHTHDVDAIVLNTSSWLL